MNDPAQIQPPSQSARSGWLEPYMPDAQLAQPQPRQHMISMAMIRGILFRQRWLIVSIIAFALIAGIVLTLLATPMYAATAKVKIAPYGSFIVDGQDLDQGVVGNQVDQYLATQVQVIESRPMADMVAANLNLGERYALLGADVDEGRPPNITDEQWLAQKTSMAARMISGMVSAELPPASWVVPIRVDSSDPALAAELANGFADAFVAFDSQDALDSNKYAREYVQEQIELVRAQLQVAEQDSNNYARSNRIITGITAGGDEASPTTLTTENLTGINGRVAAARAKRIEAEQRWLSVQNVPVAQLPEAQSNSVLQALITERTSKQTELIELQQRYNEDFPAIVSLKGEIEVLDRQLRQTGSEIKAAVRNEYTVARNQEAALDAELASLTGEKLQEQDLQVEYEVLERESQALRDQLRTLLDRYGQLSSAANVKSGAVSKLDAATVPAGPYAPSLPRNLGLALILGIALAGGLAVLRETMDDRIRSGDDLEDRLGLPSFGQTPHVADNDIDAESTDQFGALMEAYSSIRASIDFSMPRSRNVIQLTSTEAGEGKSTTSVILAELFARLGRKTLLIDTDLRKPSVTKLLDIDTPKAGLVEAVLGHCSIEDATVQGAHENLTVMPLSELPPNPADFIATPEFQRFIEARRLEYDLVILDSPPVLGLADAPMLSRMVDATIFIVEANRVASSKARAALRRIQAAGGTVSGGVVTKYKALQAGQDYGYQYSYYRYGK
jgi:capsular exopolysaccharide synthesis family protein